MPRDAYIRAATFITRDMLMRCRRVLRYAAINDARYERVREEARCCRDATLLGDMPYTVPFVGYMLTSALLMLTLTAHMIARRRDVADKELTIAAPAKSAPCRARTIADA